MLLVMRILRVLRVARLFKLARYSSGLQSFGATFSHSLQELGMLALFLATAIMFFSTVIYFLVSQTISLSRRLIQEPEQFISSELVIQELLMPLSGDRLWVGWKSCFC